MRFWFDTEFYEDGCTIELISIGVVSEDGRTYYAETVNAHELAQSSQWLAANVAPHLDKRYVCARWQIANSLIKFMGDNPEIWAYYADYDWVALCQLFGTMMDLPKVWPMYCRDVKQLCDSLGNPKLPVRAGLSGDSQGAGQEHHALADAKWTREAWLFLTLLAQGE